MVIWETCWCKWLPSDLLCHTWSMYVCSPLCFSVLFIVPLVLWFMSIKVISLIKRNSYPVSAPHISTQPSTNKVVCQRLQSHLHSTPIIPEPQPVCSLNFPSCPVNSPNIVLVEKSGEDFTTSRQISQASDMIAQVKNKTNWSYKRKDTGLWHITILRHPTQAHMLVLAQADRLYVTLVPQQWPRCLVFDSVSACPDKLSLRSSSAPVPLLLKDILILLTM